MDLATREECEKECAHDGGVLEFIEGVGVATSAGSCLCADSALVNDEPGDRR